MTQADSIRVLVSIDDTDNLDSPGTGHLAADIARDIESRGWGRCAFITRHQLLVHPDIPYTSHNSSMCFAADLARDAHDAVIAYAGEFLERRSAEGADPGLCVVTPEHLAAPDALVEFGRQAKRVVLARSDAYRAADRRGVHLSEHGGTGQGVIGALAGAALRLSGNDGRMRGSLPIPGGVATLSVCELCRLPDVDAVESFTGEALPDDALIRLGEKVKTVLLAGKSKLLVRPLNGAGDVRWRSCTNEELKKF